MGHHKSNAKKLIFNCVSGKVSYHGYKMARKAMHRVKAERVYYHAECGGWHITSYTESDYENGRPK